MASVQYGALITALKGNIGGQTFQDGNVSKVLRNKGYRKGKKSTLRQTVTARLISQVVRWRLISQSDRNAWGAASGDWPFTDKFGNTYYGSGYQYFSACNIANVSIGETPLNTPPAPISIETITPSAPTLQTGVEADWNITTTTTQPQIVQCYASAPMSPGRSGDNVAYKYIGQFDSSLADQLVDNTVYQSLFGWPPADSLVMFKMVVRVIGFPRAAQTVIQRCIVIS